MESTENRFFKMVEGFCNLVVMSLIWLLFSLPIFTIGASCTAMYYTMTKVVRNNRGYMWREFKASFKANFKQSTIIWLIYLACMFICYMDVRITGLMKTPDYFRYIFGAIMVILTVELMIALSYVARFEQTTKNILLYSALMGVRNLPYTVLAAVVLGLGIGVVWYYPMVIVIVPGACGILISMILERVFVKYMSEEDLKKEDMRNHPEKYDR